MLVFYFKRYIDYFINFLNVSFRHSTRYPDQRIDFSLTLCRNDFPFGVIESHHNHTIVDHIIAHTIRLFSFFSVFHMRVIIAFKKVAPTYLTCYIVVKKINHATLTSQSAWHSWETKAALAWIQPLKSLG